MKALTSMLATGTINPNHPATLHGIASVVLFVAAAWLVVIGLVVLVKLAGATRRRGRAVVPGLLFLVLGLALAWLGVVLL